MSNCGATNGAKIACELGITRAAVSSITKRGLRKFYKAVEKIEQGGPFAVATTMLTMLNIDNDENEISNFFKLLPRDLREIIRQDAVKQYRIKGV